MAIINMVDMVLNPLLGWLFNIPAILAIAILSVALGLVNTLLMKYMTDQGKMRRLKDDTKKYQKQMKSLQKEGKADKAMEVQKKMMPIQMQLMRESFKPLMVTMIPFLIIFFWLANHFAFLPILPGEDFTVTANFEKGMSGEVTLIVPAGFTMDEAVNEIVDRQATWTLTGPEGRHNLKLTYAGAEFSRPVLITTERSYIKPVMPLKGSIESFSVNNQKLLPMGDFDLFGWYPGWIFYYILISIPVSLGFKKLFNVV